MCKKIIVVWKRHKTLFFILLAAIILRLVYFLIIIYNFGSEGFYLTSNGDAIDYFTLAKQILARGTFQNFRAPAMVYEPEIFRMPGYPLFIAFFYKIFPSAALPVLAQNLIFVFSIAFFCKFISNIFKNKNIAFLASAFLAIEPSIIYWNNQLITETVFGALVFWSVYFSFLFYQNKKIYFAAASGLFLSLAIFVRPAGEYLAVVFIIFYAMAALARRVHLKKIIAGSLLFIIAFILPLSPWMARNKDYFGSFNVSNSSAIGFGKYLSAMNIELGEPIENITHPNKMIKAEMVRERTLEYIKEHPVVFSKVYGLSLAPFLFGDAYLSVFGRIFPSLEENRVMTDWKGAAGELLAFFRGHKGAEAAVFFGGKIIWGIISFLAFAGLYWWLFKYKKDYPILIFLLFLIAYFSLASGVGSYSRFRFPVNPYIFLFASLGILRPREDAKIRKLLIITQKVDKNDFNLGFFHRWIEEFSKKFEKVDVIALGIGAHSLPSNVNIHSLGKEKGASRFFKFIKFYWLIFKLRKNYDAVFVHMNPEYVVLGGWLWKIWKKPVYLWYVHKSVTWKLKVANYFVKKIFTANDASCRLSNRKKIKIVGHGVDTELFSPRVAGKDRVFTILSVGRMSPVKKFEIIIEALHKVFHTSDAFRAFRFILIAPIVDKYGEEYKERLINLAINYHLDSYFNAENSMLIERLPDYYNNADLFVHTSETGSIDKVVIEAMACGLPVLTSSEAFDFLPEKYRFKKGDIDDLAKKIIEFYRATVKKDDSLREIVLKDYDLDKLIDKIITHL